MPKPLSRIIFLISLIVIASSSGIFAERPASLAPSGSNAERQKLSLPLKNPKILVKKHDRQLFLFSNGKIVRTYRVALGLSPVGDKVRQGDRRTPEGDFYIFARNDKSAFYLSLGISYPNASAAERGLRDGLITKAQYAAIIQANKSKTTPPQNTKLGGDIYIHGRGTGSDWT